MAMTKTYRRDDDGVLHYLEAWTEPGGLTVHRGKVGTKGRTTRRSTRSRHFPSSPTAKERMREFVVEAEAEGYRVASEGDWSTVVLQVALHSIGRTHPDDRRLTMQGSIELDQRLGWRGLGQVDGIKQGGPPPEYAQDQATTWQIFCEVVDIPLGVKTVRQFAREWATQPFVVGSRGPGPDDDYELAWAASRRIRDFHVHGAITSRW